MNRVIVNSAVDGADDEMQVTVETNYVVITLEERRAHASATAGSVADPKFERSPQLPSEDREPLSRWTAEEILQSEG